MLYINNLAISREQQSPASSFE